MASIRQTGIEASAIKYSKTIFNALLVDPLMSKLTPESAGEMWREMIAHNRTWLPSWM